MGRSRESPAEEGERMIGICEFCGQEKDLGEATPFHGFYCSDCLKLNIENDREVLKKMKSGKRRKISAGESKSSDLKTVECVKKMMTGTVYDMRKKL